MNRISGTLVYCRRGDEVLLMRRRKAPNVGLWVAPGGKVEIDESPYECAVRELREETGLQVKAVYFRALVTEVSPRSDYQWQIFLYLVTEFERVARPDEREGTLRWWPIGALDAGKVPIPEADAVFYPHVIDLNRPFYCARYTYDAELRLVKAETHAVRV